MTFFSVFPALSVVFKKILGHLSGHIDVLRPFLTLAWLFDISGTFLYVCPGICDVAGTFFDVCLAFCDVFKAFFFVRPAISDAFRTFFGVCLALSVVFKTFSGHLPSYF